jgi:hypothetical protein
MVYGRPRREHLLRAREPWTREYALPAELPGLIADQGLIDELSSFIDRDQGHWQPVFDALPRSERSMLAPFLLDTALAQKFRTRNYDAANQLLGIANRYGMGQSPLSVQASEMLDRLVAFSMRGEADAKSASASS